MIILKSYGGQIRLNYFIFFPRNYQNKSTDEYAVQVKTKKKCRYIIHEKIIVV